MVRFFVRGFLFGTALLMLLALPAKMARAAGTWYVTTAGSDTNACDTPDNPCASVNAVLAKGGFVAGDTIQIAAGQYTGSDDTLIVMDKNATLSGGWDDSFTAQNGTTMIYGAQLRRGVQVSSGVNAILEHLWLQEGGAVNQGGGGILNAGNLTLNNVTLYNNIAFTPASTGSGGGILNLPGATLTINDSLLSGNLAQVSGGAILNQGDVTIRHSQFRLNSVGDDGSGTSTNGGGAIATITGTLKISDSELYGNQITSLQNATGSGIQARGTVILNNTTIYNSGGGDGAALTVSNATAYLSNVTIGGSEKLSLHNSGGTVHLKNSILANSVNNDCYHDPGLGGTIDSQGYNLIETTGNCILSVNDQTGIDPMLDIYGDNGYGILMLNVSPAIDAGNPNGCTDDQNNPLVTDAIGTTRADGNGDSIVRCDVGALEFDPAFCAAGPSGAPAIIAPTSKAKINKTRVPLSWERVQCANNYQVTVWQKGKPTVLVDSKTGLLAPKYKTKRLARGASYLWQVSACYDAACVKTLKWKFTINP